jgi:3-dehydroquinate synthase
MATSGVREVRVELGRRSYAVRIGTGVLTQIGRALRDLFPQGRSQRAAVVTDENVGPAYAQRVLDAMRQVGYHVHLVTVPAGDASKSLTQASRLYDEMAEARIERGSPIVALGGGMIGDLTGFVAATWLRGVPFIQCPTTVEADVDASVGGKTGINHAAGKNLIGAFYQPRLVLMDIATLDTLTDRDFRAGLAESVKHAAIRDAAFFEWHEQNAERILTRDRDVMMDLLEKNVRIKAGVVAADEREAGLRAILNFGHTIGHAVESFLHYDWRHGECVSAGMVTAARIAVRRSVMPEEDLHRLEGILKLLKLPTEIPAHISADEIIALTRMDKKVAEGKVRIVLVPRFGEAVIDSDISDQDIRQAVEETRARREGK